MKTPVLDDSRFVILFVYLLEAAIKKWGHCHQVIKGWSWSTMKLKWLLCFNNDQLVPTDPNNRFPTPLNYHYQPEPIMQSRMETSLLFMTNSNPVM